MELQMTVNDSSTGAQRTRLGDLPNRHSGTRSIEPPLPECVDGFAPGDDNDLVQREMQLHRAK